MWPTLLNIVDIPRLIPASIQRIGDAHAGLTSANRASHQSCARCRSCALHTCSMRRLIRRLRSAVNRISAKANSSRSSQAICPR
mgnify:FL=1